MTPPPPTRRRTTSGRRQPDAFDVWWPRIIGAIRDLVALAAGVWILLFKDGASPTLQLIGYACLGTALSGRVIAAVGRTVGAPNGNGRR